MPESTLEQLLAAYDPAVGGPVTVALRTSDPADAAEVTPRGAWTTFARLFWDEDHPSPWVQFRTATDAENWQRDVRRAYRERGLEPLKTERIFVRSNSEASSFLRSVRGKAASTSKPVVHEFSYTGPREYIGRSSGRFSRPWRTTAQCSCGWRLTTTRTRAAVASLNADAKRAHQKHVDSLESTDAESNILPAFSVKRGGITFTNVPAATFDLLGVYDAAGPITPTPTNEKGKTMTTRKAIVEDRMRELEAELARLNSLPTEPDGTDGANVVWWEMVFANSGGYRTYTYAAVKAGDGLWYTTGPRAPKGFTWDELVDWISREGVEPGPWDSDGESVMPTIWSATELSEV